MDILYNIRFGTLRGMGNKTIFIVSIFEGWVGTKELLEINPWLLEFNTRKIYNPSRVGKKLK